MTPWPPCQTHSAQARPEALLLWGSARAKPSLPASLRTCRGHRALNPGLGSQTKQQASSVSHTSPIDDAHHGLHQLPQSRAGPCAHLLHELHGVPRPRLQRVDSALCPRGLILDQLVNVVLPRRVGELGTYVRTMPEHERTSAELSQLAHEVAHGPVKCKCVTHLTSSFRSCRNMSAYQACFLLCWRSYSRASWNTWNQRVVFAQASSSPRTSRPACRGASGLPVPGSRPPGLAAEAASQQWSGR